MWPFIRSAINSYNHLARSHRTQIYLTYSQITRILHITTFFQGIVLVSSLYFMVCTTENSYLHSLIFTRFKDNVSILLLIIYCYNGFLSAMWRVPCWIARQANWPLVPWTDTNKVYPDYPAWQGRPQQSDSVDDGPRFSAHAELYWAEMGSSNVCRGCNGTESRERWSRVGQTGSRPSVDRHSIVWQNVFLGETR